VALADVEGGETLAKLAQLHDVRSNQIKLWRAWVGEDDARLRGGARASDVPPAVYLKTL